MSILLTNIQRFSIHDGPGIRTTVFLKGCPLRCPWCSNPENLSSSLQPYSKDGITGVYGQWYEPEELVKECLKDRLFYEGRLASKDWQICSAAEIDALPGGVTFSGGECLQQMEALLPVCEQLHRHDIHLTAETSLFVSEEHLDIALQHIDFFYCDVKILDEARCRDVLHGNLDLFLYNFKTLIESGRPVVVRIPVIGGQTDGPENRQAVKELLSKYQPLKIELLKEHKLGESKYRSLGMELHYTGVSDGLMLQYQDELSSLGVPTEICRV